MNDKEPRDGLQLGIAWVRNQGRLGVLAVVSNISKQRLEDFSFDKISLTEAERKILSVLEHDGI